MRLLVSFGLLSGSALLLLPQESSGSLKPYLGSWKGVCADGKDFVVVSLRQGEDGALGGTVQLGNMRGGEDGACVSVVDPPVEKHSLKVSDGKLDGPVLKFRGAKRMEFEMIVTGSDAARLKFIGTASEDNPWKLTRAK